MIEEGFGWVNSQRSCCYLFLLEAIERLVFNVIFKCQRKCTVNMSESSVACVLCAFTDTYESLALQVCHDSCR